MDKKVVVAGHICLDITPVFPEMLTKSVSEVLLPGKLIQTKAASVSTGGAVANTGLALKILGVDVQLMGKVGDDDFGDLICNILHKYSADKLMIRTKGEASSYSVVLALPGTDRIFLHCPGTNNTFTSDDVDVSQLSDISLFHFGYPPIMQKMYENDGAELVKLFKKVHELGCCTSLDMASVDPDSDAGKANWKAIIQTVIPYVDLFVPSVEELCFMLDKDRFIDWQNRANGKDITEILDLEKDIKPLADQCMKIGCKVLMLKCGVKGLYLKTASSDTLSQISNRIELDYNKWANQDIFEKSFKPEKVCSTTGAGDTSIAAFLTSILNGFGPEDALKLACATGACCVEGYDALSGLKPLDYLKEKITKGWEKN